MAEYTISVIHQKYKIYTVEADSESEALDNYNAGYGCQVESEFELSPEIVGIEKVHAEESIVELV